MKLSVLVTVLLFATSSLSAQPWFIKHPDLGTSFDYIYDVVPASDGGYIFTGTIGDYDINNYLKTNLIIGKFNDDGDTLWIKRYGELIGRSEGYAIAQTSDGGYVVAGKKAGESSWVNTGWLLKFNSVGDTLWTNEFEDAIFYDVIITENKGIAVAGMKGLAAGNRQALLSITDSIGNLTYENAIGGLYYDEALALVELPGGNIILGGNTNCKGAGSFDVYIMKFTNQAVALWDTTYGSPQDDRLRDLILDSNNDLVIAGTTWRNSSLENLIIKTDTLKNNIWEKTYSSSITNTLYDIQESKRGGYIGIGVYYAGAVGILPMMLRTDTDGNELWLREYIDNSFSETFAFTGLEVENNDIFLLGSGHNATFIRTDGQGTFTSAKNISNEIQLTVFPNPSNGNITLLTEPGEYSFNLYNLQGKLLRYWRKTVSGNSIIDLSKYPAGEYILNIINENKSKSVRVIKR